MMKNIIKPVNQDNWADFETLFQSRGAPHYCWCAVWRMNGKELAAADAAMKKEFMRRRVLSGIPYRLTCLFGGRARRLVFCRAKLRETYRKLGGNTAFKHIWSLACFFIKRAFGEKGLSAASLMKPKHMPGKTAWCTLRRFPSILNRQVTGIWALLKHLIRPVVKTHMVGKRRYAVIYNP